MFTGKRGSFQFFASKVESYADISNVARDKWVAVALQCMEERPTKVWGTHLKRKEREGDQMEATWEEFKTFMGNRYDSTDLVMAARQKLDHVYQGQESNEKYIERFITLLSDVETEYEICENDKIYMFLKGLNAHIRVACTINPQTGVRFSDLDVLCTYVVQYDSNLKSGGGGDAEGTGRKEGSQRCEEDSNKHAGILSGIHPGACAWSRRPQRWWEVRFSD
jgi:hypothetical protein